MKIKEKQRIKTRIKIGITFTLINYIQFIKLVPQK